jgi:hypothetical protein
MTAEMSQVANMISSRGNVQQLNYVHLYTEFLIFILVACSYNQAHISDEY